MKTFVKGSWVAQRDFENTQTLDKPFLKNLKQSNHDTVVSFFLYILVVFAKKFLVYITLKNQLKYIYNNIFRLFISVKLAVNKLCLVIKVIISVEYKNVVTNWVVISLRQVEIKPK